MLLACSHLVIASSDVPRIVRFFGQAFSVSPHFENDMFAEFVLTSAFRIAFFKPAGPTARTFSTSTERNTASIGVTVQDVDAVFATVTKLEHVLPEWNRLQNNVQTQKEAYLNYLRKEEEARISSALDESQIVNIAIAERASVPTEPESGQLKRRVIFGTMVSLLLSVGLALLRDWMDPSVKTAAQAERIAGLPVLGALPPCRRCPGAIST